MKFFDISRPLSGKMLVYPGDRTPVFQQSDNGKYRITDLCLSSHTGTHIDAPSHYLSAGDTIDTLPFGHLIGRCRVLAVGRPGEAGISGADLAGRLEGVERLLLKTWYSGEQSFIEDYPSLSLDAARCITQRGIQCIGIDSPSIESFDCDGSVHRWLLGHGCFIIELLDLSGVPEGDYTMAALPLRLEGCDGSPARVVLMGEG